VDSCVFAALHRKQAETGVYQSRVGIAAGLGPTNAMLAISIIKRRVAGLSINQVLPL